MKDCQGMINSLLFDLPLSSNPEKWAPTDTDQLSSLSTDSSHTIFDLGNNLENLADFCINSSKKKVVVDTKKFKTEMCKNWMDFGSCRYGKKCKFAHGKEEMHEKNVPNKTKYKSKGCQTFYSLGYCPYGSRCLFRHDDRNESDFHAGYYTTLLTSSSTPQHLNNKLKRRLIIFEKMDFSENSMIPEEEKEYLYYKRIFSPPSFVNYQE